MPGRTRRLNLLSGCLLNFSTLICFSAILGPTHPGYLAGNPSLAYRCFCSGTAFEHRIMGLAVLISGAISSDSSLYQIRSAQTHIRSETYESALFACCNLPLNFCQLQHSIVPNLNLPNVDPEAPVPPAALCHGRQQASSIVELLEPPRTTCSQRHLILLWARPIGEESVSGLPWHPLVLYAFLSVIVLNPYPIHTSR